MNVLYFDDFRPAPAQPKTAKSKGMALAVGLGLVFGIRAYNSLLALGPTSPGLKFLLFGVGVQSTLVAFSVLLAK
jgi:hypothetical protein